MGISKGSTNLSLEEILSRVSEEQILARYLGVTRIPCVICSPLREDKHPSFGLFSLEGKIRYKDHGTGESGSIFELLGRLWNMSFIQVISKINKDNFSNVKPAEVISVTREQNKGTTHTVETKLEIKKRVWQKWDMEYWESYGIPINLLRRANVGPISHYFITKYGKRMTFKADKYAYAFMECKENNITIKVYQPFNKRYKWTSKHDRSVLGLWRMMPDKGNMLCICSSVKDALCLTANTGIPAICLQGEAYSISETAQNVLRSRFKHVYILLDNDEPGKRDALKLQQETGFVNIELPPFEGGKDISDFYKVTNNQIIFQKTILKLFQHDT